MPMKLWLKRSKQHDMENHNRRLQAARAVTDTSSPMAVSIAKKRELDRRRHYAHIERSNMMLLERLAEVMERRAPEEPGSQDKYRKSSESAQRLRLARITEENYRLLRKIQEAEPTYSHAEWQEHNKKREMYLRNLSEFPDQYGPRPGGAEGSPSSSGGEAEGSRGKRSPSGFGRPRSSLASRDRASSRSGSRASAVAALLSLGDLTLDPQAPPSATTASPRGLHLSSIPEGGGGGTPQSSARSGATRSVASQHGPGSRSGGGIGSARDISGGVGSARSIGSTTARSFG